MGFSEKDTLFLQYLDRYLFTLSVPIQNLATFAGSKCMAMYAQLRMAYCGDTSHV